MRPTPKTPKNNLTLSKDGLSKLIFKGQRLWFRGKGCYAKKNWQQYFFSSITKKNFLWIALSPRDKRTFGGNLKRWTYFFNLFKNKYYLKINVELVLAQLQELCTVRSHGVMVRAALHCILMDPGSILPQALLIFNFSINSINKKSSIVLL